MHVEVWRRVPRVGLGGARVGRRLANPGEHIAFFAVVSPQEIRILQNLCGGPNIIKLLDAARPAAPLPASRMQALAPALARPLATSGVETCLSNLRSCMRVGATDQGGAHGEDCL